MVKFPDAFGHFTNLKPNNKIHYIQMLVFMFMKLFFILAFILRIEIYNSELFNVTAHPTRSVCPTSNEKPFFAECEVEQLSEI